MPKKKKPTLRISYVPDHFEPWHVRDIQPLINRYVQIAYERLQADGYEPDLELLNDPQTPNRIRDLVLLFWRVKTAESRIDRGDAQQAAWHMAMAVRCAQRVGLPDIEKQIAAKMQRERARKARKNPIKKIAEVGFLAFLSANGSRPTAKVLAHLMKKKGMNVPISTARAWLTEFREQHK